MLDKKTWLRVNGSNQTGSLIAIDTNSEYVNPVLKGGVSIRFYGFDGEFVALRDVSLDSGGNGTVEISPEITEAGLPNNARIIVG